eukprot:766968_1
MAMTDEHVETIKFANEILSLNEKHPHILTFDQIDLLKRQLAEAYSDLGKWRDADQIYKSVLNAYRRRQTTPYASVLTGSSRALYEMGKYDDAIKRASTLIELGRYHPGSHKYLALSQRAKGNIDEAKKTLSKAILYEWHWERDNLQNNEQLLRELSNL